jgi:hypothetical protein
MNYTGKVIGYFSYTKEGNVFCDGDACVISGSKETMRFYLKEMLPDSKEQDIIKKTKFGEIMNGLNRGGAYAFDKASYSKFLPLAKKCGMSDLPVANEFFSKGSPTGLHFIRIQLAT